MSRLFLFVALLAASLVSLAAAQSITFTQVASNTAFPPREYAFCAQTPAAVGSTPTLYFFGGFNVTLSGTSTNISATGNSYTDGYYNDVWSSSNLGSSWTQLTAAATFAPQAWGGAVRTSSGTIVLLGAGADSSSSEVNTVYTSTDGITFTAAANGPWYPRENAGIAGQAGTNNILYALGNTQNVSVDDIWLSTNAGSSWTQTCSNSNCPFINSVGVTASQVHGPAAVGLSTGSWLLIGGYGSGSAGTTIWVTNQVAYSTNGFATWSTYAAPWYPRGQMRATVDSDNIVYAYGGVYDLPYSGSGTAYPNVPGQVYYSYWQDLWYSTNAASGSATWTQLTVSGTFGGSGVYPGAAYSGNPNTGNISSSFYSNGAVFNPCLGVGYSSTGAKQLIVYTGLYVGYRQQQVAGQAVQYPGVYVGTLNFGTSSSSTGAAIANTTAPSSSTGSSATSTGTSDASMVSASVVSVAAAALLAVVASML